MLDPNRHEQVWMRKAGIEGVETLVANDSARLWRVYHDTYAVSSVLTQAGNWLYRRRHLTLKGGQLSLMEPGEIHVTLRLTAPADFRVAFISAAAMNEMALELGLGPGVHFREAQLVRPDVFRAFWMFHRCLEEGTSALEVQSSFARAVGCLLESNCEVAPKRRPRAQPAVERTRALLHDRWSEDLSLSDLVRQSGLGRFHLIRAFAAEYGMPPHAYQGRLRIAKAQHLLRLGIKAAEVALLSGFADQSHFTRHFKRVVGVTPGKYAALFSSQLRTGDGKELDL